MSVSERLAEVAAIQAKLDALDKHDCPYARGEGDDCPDPIAHASVSMSAVTARALLEEVDRLTTENAEGRRVLLDAQSALGGMMETGDEMAGALRRQEDELTSLRAFRDRVAAAAQEDVQYVEPALCDCGQYWGNVEQRPRDATGKHADDCLWLAAQQKG